ncbi:MAG: hypothetical protein IJG68_07240 [Bacilli bacterium]|nr:hypothetical protein [Bacilli bacterium]
MKKKSFIFVLICFVLLFGLCGCKNGKESNEKSIKKGINSKYTFKNKIVCDALDDDVVSFGYNMNYFVTKNKVYQFNKDKLFSNDQNCKEIEIEELDSDIIAIGGSIDTKYSTYSYEPSLKKFSPYYHFSNGEISSRRESFYKQWFDGQGDNIRYSYAVNNLKNYMGIIFIDDSIKMFGIKNNNIYYADVEHVFESDEEILIVFDGYLRTNKAFYKIKAYKMNKEECEKYADVSCKYGFKLEKDQFLNQYYDDIKYAGKNILIDNNNNYYYFHNI